MIFKSKDSFYLYSEKHNKILLLHPTLVHIIRQEEKLPGMTEGKEKSFLREKINYYYKKYRLLKENGYFEKIDEADRITGRYSGKSLEDHLHNNGHLIFEVTDYCNLKCSYCIYGELYQGYSFRKNHYLSLKKAKNIFDYMVDFWNSPKNHSYNKEIRIGFYGGESLLNFPFIKEMVQYAKKIRLKHNSFTFGLTTNGTLLDKYMEYLAENRFRILISLDGDEKSNGFRVFQNGKPVYKTIYNNIIKLRGRFPAYFEKYVDFNAVLHRLNSLEGIYNFFESNFNKIPHITEVSLSDVKDSQREVVNNMYRSISDSVKQAKNPGKLQNDFRLSVPPVSIINKVLHQYSGDTFKKIKDFLYSGVPGSRTPTASCVPLQRRLFLTADGKILPCERVSHIHTLGRVTEEKVEIDFDKIAEKYNQFFDRLADQCRLCSGIKTCRNCVLKMETGKKGYQCRFISDQVQLKKYLSQAVTFLEENQYLYKKISKELFLE